LTGESLEKTINDSSGKNFSIFKEDLSQLLIDKITPISVEIKKLLNDKKYLDEILIDGCKKADDIASEKIKKIHQIVGF
jgi:tryptophanyl-tRNA synthetase